MWPTPLVCPGDEGEPTRGCKITDPSTGFSYDLAEAALAGDFYRVCNLVSFVLLIKNH